MKLTFNKIRLSHIECGLATKIDELDDKIIVDLSRHTVVEIIKGEKQENLWPYVKLKKTHLKGIYTLSIGEKGYFNDWNFKPKGLKKLAVWCDMHKNIIVPSMISGIFCGVVSNIIFYFLTFLF